MKKIIPFLIGSVLATVCLAEQLVTKYDLVDFETITVTTNANTGSAYKQRIDGKSMSISVAVSGTTPTCTVSVVTLDGTGSSIAGAKSIYSATLSANMVTNLALPVYMWQDTVYVNVVNASDNVTTTKVNFVIER